MLPPISDEKTERFINDDFFKTSMSVDTDITAYLNGQEPSEFERAAIDSIRQITPKTPKLIANEQYAEDLIEGYMQPWTNATIKEPYLLWRLLVSQKQKGRIATIDQTYIHNETVTAFLSAIGDQKGSLLWKESPDELKDYVTQNKKNTLETEFNNAWQLQYSFGAHLQTILETAKEKLKTTSKKKAKLALKKMIPFLDECVDQTIKYNQQQQNKIHPSATTWIMRGGVRADEEVTKILTAGKTTDCCTLNPANKKKAAGLNYLHHIADIGLPCIYADGLNPDPLAVGIVAGMRNESGELVYFCDSLESAELAMHNQKDSTEFFAFALTSLRQMTKQPSESKKEKPAYLFINSKGLQKGKAEQAFVDYVASTGAPKITQKLSLQLTKPVIPGGIVYLEGLEGVQNTNSRQEFECEGYMIKLNDY